LTEPNDTKTLTRELADERLTGLAADLSTWPVIRAIRDLAGSWKTSVYLVGGVLRDAILDRPLSDLDLALPESALEFAMELSEMVDGTFVVLDEIHGAGRVVMPEGPTVDVSDFRRPKIEDDCLARDLTCNGMAAELEQFITEGPAAVVDPAGAFDDLTKGIIRTHTSGNLAEDPLRILRVFRYSATCAFPIDPTTLKAVKEHAHRLPDVAAERVLQELVYIFRSENARSVLPGMVSTGVLGTLFPFFTGEEISAWVGRAAWIERALKREPPLPGFDATLTDPRGFRLVTMLAASIPGTRIADLIGSLRLGKKIVGRVMRVSMTLVSVRRLVNQHPLEQDFIAITARILLSLRSDRLAAWLIMAADGEEEKVLPVLEKAEKLTIKKILPIADAPPLITGGELAQELDKAPGPWISELLEAIFFERIWDNVTDRASAIEFARNWLTQQS
jgi:tRNA nucleotidyltransferase/poly(A) polymerase